MSVVIQSGFTGITYGLDNPRIGWRRLTGTVTATNEAAGYAATNATNSRTDTFWKPSALSSRLTLDFGTAQDVSYCGVASHTIGSTATEISAQIWDGSSWISMATVTPTDDSPLFFLFGTRNVTQVRISLNGTTPPLVGVVFWGKVTEVPQKAVYAPSVSMERAKVTEFSTNTTEGGQWAGRSVSRRYTTPKMQVDNLSESWIASEFDAFAAYAEAEPFFVADKPLSYPKSAAYAWATGDLTPQRQIANADVANTVSMDLIGFRHG